jgi:hypothetical protein
MEYMLRGTLDLHLAHSSKALVALAMHGALGLLYRS